MADKIKTCVLCKTDFIGWGNNPEPLKSKGVCCDICNLNKVVPARIEERKINDLLIEFKEDIKEFGFGDYEIDFSGITYNKLKKLLLFFRENKK